MVQPHVQAHFRLFVRAFHFFLHYLIHLPPFYHSSAFPPIPVQPAEGASRSGGSLLRPSGSLLQHVRERTYGQTCTCFCRSLHSHFEPRGGSRRSSFECAGHVLSAFTLPSGVSKISQGTTSNVTPLGLLVKRPKASGPRFREHQKKIAPRVSARDDPEGNTPT